MDAIHRAISYGKNVLTNRQYFWHLFWMILVGELVLGHFIIQFVPYTEIDWKVYMEQAHFALFKTYDYSKYIGETGPAVYPAGFIHLFSLLYKVTNEGKNILLAQYIFLGLYVATLAIVMILYHRSNAVPQWSILLLCLSKRVKSIYYLRLFNEGILMLPFLLFTYQQWFFGLLALSAALSIKMNILLYFPALLLLLFESMGVLRAIFLFTVAVAFQVIIAVPWIAENAAGYFGRAFEFGRVFTFKWTVNLKFLPIEIFVNPTFGKILLLIQLSLLLLFIFKRWTKPMGGIWRVVQSDPFGSKPRNLLVRICDWFCIRDYNIKLTPEHIMTTLFTSNLIGIACSRSMHYQFYNWYFHSLPYLVWRTNLPTVARLVLLVAIELVFNIYPSTPASSILLQMVHITLMICLYLRKTDMSYIEEEEEEEEEEKEEKEKLE